VPQPPQLFGSVCSSTHAALQTEPPAGHPHAELVQISLFEHAVVHAPQWAAVDVRSTQAPLQSVSPAPQVEAQVLFEQTVLPEQRTPHPPQFVGSEVVSTHTPLQDVPVEQGPVSGTPTSTGGTVPSAVTASGSKGLPSGAGASGVVPSGDVPSGAVPSGVPLSVDVMAPGAR